MIREWDGDVYGRSYHAGSLDDVKPEHQRAVALMLAAGGSVEGVGWRRRIVSLNPTESGTIIYVVFTGAKAIL